MSPQEIEKQINKIALGSRYISIKNQCDDDIVVILKSLSLQDKSFIEFIFQQSKDKARELGIYSKLDLINEFKRRNVWTEIDDKNLEDTRDNLRKLYEQKKDLKTGKLKRIQRTISFSEKKMRDLLGRKNVLFNNSIEDYSRHQQVLATVYCRSHNECGERLWATFGEFLKNEDPFVINKIVSEMNSQEHLSTKEFRKIARNSHWRFRWNAAKSIGDLFGKPILELDSDQQNLLYWSQVYDSVYESYERPSSEIIDDDEALDNWFEEQDKKDKKKSLEKGGTVGKINVSEKVMGHGEVFIVTTPIMNPDTIYRKTSPNLPTNEDVSNLNDGITKEFKRKELERIKEKGEIQETGLRSRRNKIARKLIGSKAAILQPNKVSGQARGNNRKIVPGENIS